MKVYFKGKVLDKFTRVVNDSIYYFIRIYQDSQNSFIDVLLRSVPPEDSIAVKDFYNSLKTGSYALVSAVVYPRKDGKKGFNVSADILDIVLSDSNINDEEIKSLVEAL